MTIISIVAYIFCLTAGVFVGIFITRYFSSFVIEKLEIAFNNQIDLYQKFSKEFLENQVKIHEIESQRLNKKQNIINQNIDTTNSSIIKLFTAIKDLYSTINRIKELENEIIKYKKIIKRMEKKNV